MYCWDTLDHIFGQSMNQRVTCQNDELSDLIVGLGVRVGLLDQLHQCRYNIFSLLSGCGKGYLLPLAACSRIERRRWCRAMMSRHSSALSIGLTNSKLYKITHPERVVVWGVPSRRCCTCDRLALRRLGTCLCRWCSRFVRVFCFFFLRYCR